MIYNILIAISIIILGLVTLTIGTVFGNLITELKIALMLAGAAFVFTGTIQIVQELDKKRESKRNEAKHQQILAKLEEIKLELEKEESPKNKGVAIADIISSGLKYYAEHLGQPKEDKKDD